MTDASASVENKGKQKPNRGNGGTTDKYTWSQTLSELTVVLNVPAGTTGKDMVVKITDSELFVKVGNNEAMVNGRFHNKVKADESFWQLDRADGTVTVSLEKVDGMNWWECVLQGDEEIDVSKVQPGNSKLEELDGETRGMVEKMMFDQRQKAMGLPTSEEKQRMDALEKFKQQHPEMDFSNVKMM
eukprot:GFKZ01009843.1.p1 GENE.GFKZ01009843.1~~GFKZ01009843.1.p1  ORF type:complete len:186 (+),score=33.10 GFKZ01009843.1:1157-1714(+)